MQIETDTHEGEVHVQEGIKRQQIFEYQKPWKDAEDKCEEYGGHLASVTTREEIVSAESCWIGLNGTKDQIWKWSDRSSWNFTNFYDTPSTHADKCVVTLKDGRWRKRSCE